MRNILAKIPGKNKASFAEKLKQICLQPDYESAKSYAARFIDDHEKQFTEAIDILESGLEDSL